MIYASALELRRLTAALWTLGVRSPLPCRNQSRSNFVLLTLLKLQYLIEPPRFACDGVDTQVSPPASLHSGDPSQGAAAAAVEAAKTPKERLQLLQHVAVFMLQRVGILLDLAALYRAEGPAVAELLRLAETLAAAAKASLERQQTERKREADSGQPRKLAEADEDRTSDAYNPESKRNAQDR